MPRTVTATRYVTPLREGGSLPGLVEADDDGLYVLKFRGAGQGPKALAAELVAGEVARALGLPVPEIVFIDLDPAAGATWGSTSCRARCRSLPRCRRTPSWRPTWCGSTRSCSTWTARPATRTC